MGEPNTSPSRSRLQGVVAAAIVLVLTTLVAGHILGVPVLLSYAESDSMEPTIERGDGFVVVPDAVAGGVETGDVIVFDAQEIEGGEFTTHRVVDETEQGYVTRGDANVVTDQDGTEPHVTDGQVVGTVLQVNGEVVTIPHLGSAIMGVQTAVETAQLELTSVLGTGAVLEFGGPATLLLVVGLATLGAAVMMDRRASDRERSRTRTRENVYEARLLVAGLAIVLCLVTAGTMVAMSETTEAGIVSAEFDSDAPHVIPAGETDEHTYELRNGGILPVVTIVEPASDGIAVEGDPQTLHRGETVNKTVAVTAPPETGYYLRSFAEHRYFAVLPTPIVAGLHAVHPWLAMGAVTGVLVSVFVLPFAIVLGSGTIRTRKTRRSGPRRSILRRIR